MIAPLLCQQFSPVYGPLALILGIIALKKVIFWGNSHFVIDMIWAVCFVDDYSQKTYTLSYRQQCKYHSKVLQIMFCFTNWYRTLIIMRTLLVMAYTAIA